MKINRAVLLLAIESMILFCLVGGFGIFSLSHLDHDLNGTHQGIMNIYDLAEDLKNNILDNRRWEKDIIIHASVPEKQKEYLEEFAGTVKEVNDLISKLYTIIRKNPELDFDAEDVNQLRNDYKVYTEAVNMVAFNSISNTSLTAVTLNQLMEPAKKKIYNCERYIYNLDAIAKNLHARDMENISKYAHDFSKIMFIIAVACALFIIIFFLRHRYHVLKGIRLLDKKMIEIASGSIDFSKEVKWSYDDDFLPIVNHLNEFISNIKEVYQGVSEKEENLRVTLNSIGDAVVVSDKYGNITHLNPVAEKLTGWSQTEAFGVPANDVLSLYSEKGGGKLPSPFNFIIGTVVNISLPNEKVLHSRTGEEYVVSDTVTPIRNKDRELIGAVMVFHDITAQQELELRVRQSEKMDVIGQLAGGIAHDFNNMLGGVIGAVELMLQESPTPIQNTYLDMILSATKQASLLNRKILDFSRKGKKSSIPFALHNTIRDAVQLLKHSIDKNIEIELDLAADLDLIMGDAVQIQNVILNLGVNARDAMPNGGIIYISTEKIFLDRRNARLSGGVEQGDYLKISVKDSGSGIEDNVVNHIFEPFYTTKEVGKGTGLGLTAVSGVISDHEGYIDVISKVGIGTEFTILLPLSKSKRKTTVEKKSVVHGEGTILIIDDEKFIRDVTASLLESAGYKTLLAKNGDEGILLYQKNRHLVDLVLLDTIMPSMGGRECFRILQEIDSQVKVVLSSGFFNYSLSEVEDLGAQAFLPKPYHSAELTSTISHVLRQTEMVCY